MHMIRGMIIMRTFLAAVSLDITKSYVYCWALLYKNIYNKTSFASIVLNG